MLAAPAAAQTPCAPRDHVLKELAKNYAEAVVAGGITGTGALVELLTSPDGGTWTFRLIPEEPKP